MLIKDTIKVLKHESSKWWTFFPQNFFSWYSSLTLLDKPDFRDLITYAFIFFFFFSDLFFCCGIFYLFLDRTNKTKRVKKKEKKIIKERKSRILVWLKLLQTKSRWVTVFCDLTWILLVKQPYHSYKFYHISLLFLYINAS